MSKIIRLMDRTRTVTDWKCPRARYYGYEFGGRGVVKNSTSLELFIGITVHDALATIAFLKLNDKDIPIDDLAQTAHKQVYDELIKSAQNGIIESEAELFANEQSALVEGLIRGFYLHVWPRLMAKYPTIITAEAEAEYPLLDNDEEEFIFMAKPDLLLEDEEGEWHYIEYKTTSSKKETWINSWETAVQLHSSVKAVEHTYGTMPSSVEIIGLYKGYESYGKQSSPFCYAYFKKGNPPFTEDQVSYEFKPGYKRTPTWELEGGVKKWVELMPEDILANQFPMTGPIYVDEDLVRNFFEQRLIREKEIVNAIKRASNNAVNGNMVEEPAVEDDYFNTVYPQRFDQCSPSFGYGCQYKPLCFGHVDDPINAGFVWREPHHAAEREALGLD